MTFLKNKEVPKSPVIYDKKYLIFGLGDEKYAIDILAIKEIRGDIESLGLTRIADSPKHVLGIIYIHNLVIPIVDLQVFYHIDKESILEKKKIMILISIANKLIGLVVNSVPDIIELGKGQLKPLPEINTIIHQSFIDSVGVLQEGLILILNIEKLILSNELQLGKHVFEVQPDEN